MKVSRMRSSSGPRGLLPAILVLAVILGILTGLYLYAHSSEEEESVAPADYAEYESGTVIQILTDNCEADEVAEGAYRGEQTLLVEVTSGQYKGETLMVTNAVGPMYGEPAEVGESIVMIINTYSSGEHPATV